MATFIQGLEQITLPYKAVILDAWGVLYNGVEVYPYVLTTLQKLRENGKKILVLSNAPRMKNNVKELLLKCGIHDSFYDYLHSSGEEGYLTLKGEHRFGKACYHMGENAHRSLFDYLSLNRVEKMEQADFVLNTGFISTELNKTSKDAELQKARDLNLLMLCFNPDYKVYVGDNLLLCAGAFAQRYEEFGGKVHYFGKPHPNVYERALGLLKTSADETIAVGDSFATDIKGGNKMGIKTILTLTGIHASQLYLNEMIDENELRNLSELHQAYPDFVIPQLRWSLSEV